MLPNTPPGYSRTAEYHSRIGKTKIAERAIEKVLTFPPHPSLYCSVGKANANMGKYKRAIDFFDKGLRMAADDFPCLMAKGSLLATCPDPKFRNPALAMKLASEAYQNKKLREWEKWEPTMVLAEAHAESGNFKEAVRFAKEALERAGPDFGRREEFLEKLSLFEKKMPYRAKKVDPID
jgi:tetratricopeptide (TPR) repeat protein